MPRNMEGLKRSARLRSESVMQRALAALQRMDASDQEINFRSVAAEAGVSTAWLYSQERLRGRIMRSRRTMTDAAPPASASQDRARASRSLLKISFCALCGSFQEPHALLFWIPLGHHRRQPRVRDRCFTRSGPAVSGYGSG